MPGTRKLPLLIALFFIYAFVNIDPDIQSILDRLKNFYEDHTQEKVYLHIDKPFYSIGDTIYFKAYLANAENNLPSTLSNILYVELFNDQQSIVNTLKLQVTNGIAWGSIPLDDSLYRGNYLLRSYTNRMKNSDEIFFFHQEIVVGNALNSSPSVATSFYIDSATNKPFASLTYTSADKNLIASKEISYTIFNGAHEVLSNKGFTDRDGKIIVSLPTITGNNTYELLTNIAIDEDNTVTNRIKIEMPAEHNSIKFFPEGGQLVNDLPAVVGIEAIDKNGIEMKLNGDIINERGDEITGFVTGFAGIGSFTFTPQAGHEYSALIRYPTGRQEKLLLPKANNHGYAFSINNSDNNILKLQVSEKGTETKEVMLVGHCGSNIVAAEKLKITNGIAVTSISKEKLPTGINHFTVFDITGKPVAERLVFINNNDNLEINLTHEKKNDKMTIVLEVKDEFGEPVQGSFSASVMDASSINPKNNEQTIISNLLMQANLEGPIKAPGYYFNNINAAKIKELDNLMLTKRWRRFAWGDVLSGNYTGMPFKTEPNLAVTGKVISSKGAALPNAKVTLLSKAGTGFILDTITNEKGEFSFDRLNIQGEMLFAIKAVGADGSENVFIKLDNTGAPKGNLAAYTRNREYDADTNINRYLAGSAARFNEMRKLGLLHPKTVTLKEVTVKTKETDLVKEAVKPSGNLNGPGRADQVITYADLGNCTTLEACLLGKLKGVILKRYIINGIPYQVPYATNAQGKAMLIVVDGQPFDPLDGSFSLENFTAGDVQSIEVLRSSAYVVAYGMFGSGGVLVITTKRGGIDYNNFNGKEKKNALPPKGVIFFKFNGYSSTNDFVNYNLPSGNDTKSTVYWKPDIITDKNGKAVIEFPVSAKAASLNVVIEGMSGEGKLGTANFTIK